MLNKMSLLLAAAVVALSAGAAGASDYNRGYGDNHRHHNNGAISIDFGTVAFGYNDGYWDTGHRWHNWRNQNDYNNYRSHGSNYHGWKHNRDHDNGWRNR